MIEGGGTAAAVNGTTNYSPGKFMLLTPGAQKNGCLPGWYKVVFLKTLPVGKDGKPLSDEELENLESPPQTKSVIPEEYTDVDTSGIKVQVLPKNNQPFIFELSSK